MLTSSLNFYTHTQLRTYTHATIHGTVHFSVMVTTIGSRSIIGTNVPLNTCTVKWLATADVGRWECRATKEGQENGVGRGYLCGSGAAVSGGTEISLDVTNTMLQQGDGLYRISVYVQKNNIWYGD